MERSSIINTVTLIFVVITMIVLLKTNNVPHFLLPSTDSQKTATTASPINPIKPVVVLPGTLKKPVTVPSTTAPLPANSVLTRKGIIAETNKSRASNSVAKVTENSELDLSAQAKAEDILKKQYFAHVAPDGKTVSDLVAAQGYVYIKIGENLALGGFTGDADVVTAWMNSPGHRANILDPQFTEMGVGVAHGMYDGHMVYVAVQHFGRPRSACPTIDTELKSQLINAQSYLDELVSSLTVQKTAIDKGSDTGTINTLINAYNNLVGVYQKAYADAKTLRAKYNAEVAAFNTCLTGSSN